MKNKKILLILFTLFLVVACSEHTEEDFIGIWKSELGNSIIILNDDNTCSGILEPEFFFDKEADPLKLESGFYNEKIFYELKNDTVIFKNGSWEYNLDKYNNRWKISILDNSSQPRSINFSLFIEGSGILKNNHPWYLFIFKGDPDEYNLFKFIKE